MNFALISFPEEDDSLGVIPTNWITSSGHSCYYPCVISDFTKNKLVLTRQEPGNDWVEVEIKILKKFETYKAAKSHMVDAETYKAAKSHMVDAETYKAAKSHMVDAETYKAAKSHMVDAETYKAAKSHMVDAETYKAAKSHMVDAETYKAAKSHMMDAETTVSTGVAVGNSESKTRSIRVSKRPRKKRKIILPGESSSSEDEIHIKKKFVNRPTPNSPPLSSSSTDYEFTQSPTTSIHFSLQTPPKHVDFIEETLLKLPRCTVQLSPTLKNHTVQISPKLKNNTEQPPPTPTNNIVETPPTLTNNAALTPPTLTNNAVQTRPTLTNNPVQTPPSHTNNAVQTPPTLTNNVVQTPPTLTNNTVQTPPSLTNNAVQTPPTLTNNVVQTPPSPTNNAVKTPPSLTNNVVQTPPSLTNNAVQTPPSPTNNAVQTPSKLIINTVKSLPTLTNYTVQTPSTLKALLEPSSPTTLYSDPTTNKSPTTNQNTHEPKFEGLLRLVSPSSCASSSLPPSQPVHVNVNTRSRSLEEPSVLSPTFSSPGSSSSSTSIKSEILSLRQNQEMMWVVLSEISQKLDSVCGSLARLESRNDVEQVPKNSHLENGENGWLSEIGWLTVNFPLNKTDFNEFEEKLLDSTFRHKILRILSCLSGNTIKNLAACIMKKLLTDELAEEYSLTGKTFACVTKKAFDKTRSFMLVCQVCFQKFVGGEEREIREGVSDWLMQAKFRRLRRIKRRATLNDRRDQLITLTE